MALSLPAALVIYRNAAERRTSWGASVSRVEVEPPGRMRSKKRSLTCLVLVSEYFIQHVRKMVGTFEIFNFAAVLTSS